MARYRISSRPQLASDIYDYTGATFGPYQATAYHAGLEDFTLLADFPRIGQQVDELAPQHRRFRFQAHFIFYTEESDHVLIRAISITRATYALSFSPEQSGLGRTVDNSSLIWGSSPEIVKWANGL